MMHTPPIVDAAFSQLVAALDAESAELRKIGGEVFHTVDPRRAQVLLQSAKAHEKLREQIAGLYESWKSGLPVNVPPPDFPIPVRAERAERRQPGLIKNIKGINEKQAAERLCVQPAKIREWLESGLLKGYRRVSGSWKITQADLAGFSREHRDLL